MELEYARMTGLTGLGGSTEGHEKPRPDLSILTDPTLVEDYEEIMKSMPRTKKDEELHSVNASVVITPTEARAGNGLGNVLGNGLRETTSEDEKDEKGQQLELEQPVEVTHHNEDAKLQEDEEGVDAGDVDNSFSSLHANDQQDSDYAYSDSDFEDNLEERLRSLDTTYARKEVDDRDHDASSAGVDLDAKTQMTRRLDAEPQMHDVSSDYDEDEDEEEEEDGLTLGLTGNNSDEDEDDDFQPLKPPQELDPNKLYALYPFQGPDPSHCQLEQDESCTLLNDQDAYWWLVKRCSDGKIGFAPAELLETFPERLARLNCWKNENMSSQSISHINEESTSSTDFTDREKGSQGSQGSHRSVSPPLNSYSKTNKSVSFINVVSYAERYIEEVERHSEEENELLEDGKEDDNDSGEINGNEVVNTSETDKSQPGNLTSFIKHVDEVHQTHLNDQGLDDVSEVVSDAAFNVHEMAPLMVQKNRPATRSPPAEAEKTTDLRQVFQAPIMPVAASKGSSAQMSNSNSNCSISTIGEYSPSSSEFTNDSPQLPNEDEFKSNKASDQIPSSRAIQDISRIVGSPENVSSPGSVYSEQGQEHEREDEEAVPDISHPRSMTHSYKTSISTLTAADSSSVEEDNINNSSVGTSNTNNNTNHNESTNNISTVPSSTASSYMDHQHSSPSFSDLTLHTNTPSTRDFHPMINTLYNPIFSKIDIMMEKIERAISQ